MNTALKAVISATLMIAAAGAAQTANVSVMDSRSMSGSYNGMHWTARRSGRSSAVVKRIVTDYFVISSTPAS